MKNGLAVFAIGLTCGVMSGWGAGCSDHGAFAHLPEPQASTQDKQQDPTPSPSSSPALSGNWICDDSQCPSNEVLNLSDTLNSITTEATVRFPQPQPQSVCRIQESQALSVSSQNGLQLTGSLQNPQYKVLDSPENTHDCQDYYDKLNQSAPSSQPVSISLASGTSGTPELTFNGVHYRQASDQDLHSVDSSVQAQDSVDASVAGTWNCADSSCDQDEIVTISGDLSSMTTYETFTVTAEKQSCRIAQAAKLSITDSSDPDRLQGALAPQAPSLVLATGDTSDCDVLVKELGQDPGSNQTVTLERDGNQALVVNGQRFLRSQETGS